MMENDNNQLSIFLCHASEDKEIVRSLYRKLLIDGFDAWLDVDKLLPGQDWRLEIEKAIKQSNVVIVCLTNNSVTKEGYVQREIKLALDVSDEKPEGTIFIIPVRLEDCVIPERLSQWQWVNYFAEDGYELLTKSLRQRTLDFCRKLTKPKANESFDEKLTNDIYEEPRLDIGISFDDQGNSIISIAPTLFFDHRLRSAFPGIRGLHWFEDSKEALNRLEILLRKPLTFDEGKGYEVMTDPIWWFRGHRALDIGSLLRVNDTKCILDIDELLIKKVAIFHSDFYWQSFVYVEFYGEEPIGIYSHSQEDMEYMGEKRGFVDEEYAMFNGIPISRQCYDDGAAEIDGKVVDIFGAKLRVRYLTDYNIVITSKFSPINSTDFSRRSQPLFDGILRGTKHFDYFLDYIMQLPRHRKDE